MGLSEVFGSFQNCIVAIPLIPLCFYPVQGFVKSRISTLLLKIAGVLFGFLAAYMAFEYFIFPLPQDTNFILVIAGIFSFYYYNKEVRLSFARKLFVFLTVCLVGTFSLLFATVFDYNLHPSGNYMAFSQEALAVQMIFLVAANAVLYLPFSRYLGWMMENFQEEAVWKRICFFPALFMVVLYSLVPHRYSTIYTGNVKRIYPVLLLFLAFLVLLVYSMFYIIAFTYVQQQKMEYTNQLLSMQGAQYQQLLRTVEENSRIRHDFRHQLIVISELVSQKEYDRLEEYVRNYIDDAQAEVKLYSYSAAVNALISYYESICLRRNIRTDFLVSLPDRLPVSDQDFCVMLGNLLENAIEGANDTDDPYIHLKIRQTASNMLAVKVANPYQGEFQIEEGHYRSSKREGFGQGLESVNAIADKHQGVMEVLAGRHVFTVKVLLQIP